jgi:butyryl-CoA dehydrogenase/short/branched chain acyl-CoA dehydrogenase
MSESLMTVPAAMPITHLSGDEKLFQDTVRQFARETIQPLVRQMDDEQHFADGLVAQLFGLGLMGIEVPEEFGGAGGTFFQAILAVEELSAVDPSVGVLVDVQNTLCVNALVKWGSAEQKQRFLPKLATDTVCSYALSEASSGSDAFALQTRAEKRGDGYVLNGRKLWITNAHEAGLFIVFATVDRGLGTRGSRRFCWKEESLVSASARKKTSWAFARLRPAS